jgi:hypothetical protein
MGFAERPVHLAALSHLMKQRAYEKARAIMSVTPSQA